MCIGPVSIWFVLCAAPALNAQSIPLLSSPWHLNLQDGSRFADHPACRIARRCEGWQELGCESHRSDVTR